MDLLEVVANFLRERMQRRMQRPCPCLVKHSKFSACKHQRTSEFNVIHVSCNCLYLNLCYCLKNNRCILNGMWRVLVDLFIFRPMLAICMALDIYRRLVFLFYFNVLSFSLQLCLWFQQLAYAVVQQCWAYHYMNFCTLKLVWFTVWSKD